MDWKEYVGEMFLGPDEHLYEAEIYDPEYGFRLYEIGNSSNKIIITPNQLCERYKYVFNPQTKPMIKSINNTDIGYRLMDRAMLNLHMGMPISEIVGIFQAEGYDMYDIYLTIRAAELLNK